MWKKSLLFVSVLLCVVFLNVSSANAQFSAGGSLGYYYNFQPDVRFQGSLGKSIHALYKIKRFRFGARFTKINDMKMNESWALKEFNRSAVISNTAKITYKPALSAVIQFNLLKNSEKVNLFVGNEIGLFKYDKAGAIEMGEIGSSTVITLEEEEYNDVLLFGKASLEVKITDPLDLFIEVGIPLIDNPIFSIQFGALFNIGKGRN